MDEYIEMIVDSYDGNLDAEGECLLGEAMVADPSLREMYRLYGEALRCRVPVEKADTVELRKRIASGMAFRRRAPLRRMVATLSAAAVIVAIVLTVTLSPRGDGMRMAMVQETVDTDTSVDSCVVTFDLDAAMACDVREESRTEDVTVVDQAVAPPSGHASSRVRVATDMVEDGIGLREEFMLAVPMLMIEVEHDPADMLCGLSEIPAIDAGHTVISPSVGFAGKLYGIIRMFI